MATTRTISTTTRTTIMKNIGVDCRLKSSHKVCVGGWPWKLPDAYGLDGESEEDALEKAKDRD
eukprot:1103317-Amphidinium_carterae.1